MNRLGCELVLDGEIISAAGRPGEFYNLAGTMASRRRHDALAFVAFDVVVEVLLACCEQLQPEGVVIKRPRQPEPVGAVQRLHQGEVCELV